MAERNYKGTFTSGRDRRSISKEPETEIKNHQNDLDKRIASAGEVIGADSGDDISPQPRQTYTEDELKMKIQRERLETLKNKLHLKTSSNK
jgi:hypothetical protein